MGIKVENDFVIPAPIEDAWRVLIDIPRVVPCMPGSAVTEVIDDHRFRATARIKVGPVELQFRGEGELFDIDPMTHASKLRAKGSDAKGRGSFQSEMAFVLTQQGEQTRAIVTTDITLSGSVAQYGRGAGLIKEITNQLTAQFAGNLSALIAADRVVQQAAKQAGNTLVKTRSEHSLAGAVAAGTEPMPHAPEAPAKAQPNVGGSATGPVPPAQSAAPAPAPTVAPPCAALARATSSFLPARTTAGYTTPPART